MVGLPSPFATTSLLVPDVVPSLIWRGGSPLGHEIWLQFDRLMDTTVVPDQIVFETSENSVPVSYPNISWDDDYTLLMTTGAMPPVTPPVAISFTGNAPLFRTIEGHLVQAFEDNDIQLP